MKRIIITLLALWSISVVTYGQSVPKMLSEGSLRIPIQQISPVENPAGMSFFCTYLRRLSLDSITNLGFASYGNSVSGPYSVSLLTQLRKYFYFKMLTYPSSYNASLTITQKVVRASYADSSINQSTAIGSPSNFTYISSGDHLVLNNNDSLAGNTGLQVGHDMARFIFAKTPTSGTAVITIRDAITDTIVRTQTINLFNADTTAYGKVEFTGLPEYLRYKFSVLATSDSIFLLKVIFMYSKGLTPLQLGRGGSTLQNNLYANRAIMKGLIDDFNIRLIMVSAKEEAPRTSYPAMRDSMAKYTVSKLMIGSLPDSGPADTQVVYNAIARNTLVPAGWSYVDAYNAFGGYVGLSSIGAQGDGTHPSTPPYDVITNRIISQFGLELASNLYKGNIDNIDAGITNYVKTGQLWIQTGGNNSFEANKVLAMASAGSTSPLKYNMTNVNYLHFNSSTSGMTGLEGYGSQGVIVRNGGEMRAGKFTVSSSANTSQFGVVQINRGLEVNSETGAYNLIVRGDNDNNLLVTNAAQDRVSIGSTSSGQKFTVTGSTRITDSLYLGNVPAGNSYDSTLIMENGQVKSAPLNFSSGLTNSSGTITNNLSTGINGGQSILGGTATNNSLSIKATNVNGSTGGNPAIVLQSSGALSNDAAWLTHAGTFKQRSAAVGIVRFNGSATAVEGAATTGAVRYHFYGSSGTFTVPAAPSVDGWTFTLFNAGSGSVTVDVSGGASILFDTGGLTNTFSVGVGASRTFTWDASGGYYTVD